jgi:hypothetical protein
MNQIKGFKFSLTARQILSFNPILISISFFWYFVLKKNKYYFYLAKIPQQISVAHNFKNMVGYPPLTNGRGFNLRLGYEATLNLWANYPIL